MDATEKLATADAYAKPQPHLVLLNRLRCLRTTFADQRDAFSVPQASARGLRYSATVGGKLRRAFGRFAPEDLARFGAAMNGRASARQVGR